MFGIFLSESCGWFAQLLMCGSQKAKLGPGLGLRLPRLEGTSGCRPVQPEHLSCTGEPRAGLQHSLSSADRGDRWDQLPPAAAPVPQPVPGCFWLGVSPVSTSAGAPAGAGAWPCSCPGAGLAFGLSGIAGLLLAPLRSPCGAAQLRCHSSLAGERVQLLHGALSPPALLCTKGCPAPGLSAIPMDLAAFSCQLLAFPLVNHSCFALRPWYQIYRSRFANI